MSRLEYDIGQLIGKGDVLHEFVKEIDFRNKHGRRIRKAVFKCHFCKTEFESMIATVKSGKTYSCGCKTRNNYSKLIGSSYAEKFKTNQEKEDLINQWVMHRKDGRSMESFRACSKGTFNKLKETHPHIFTPEKLHEAESEYAYYMETIGRAGMLGTRQINANIWMFIMKNTLGWSNDPKRPVDTDEDDDRIIYEFPEGMEDPECQEQS